jgi:hypothetical protein
MSLEVARGVHPRKFRLKSGPPSSTCSRTSRTSSTSTEICSTEEPQLIDHFAACHHPLNVGGGKRLDPVRG